MKPPAQKNSPPKHGGDQQHKRLLQNKQTLALVLKSCCPEFHDHSIAEIVQVIEPDNPSNLVRGENVEITDGSSNIVLDTLTSVDLGSCPMLINVEVQAKRNPGYSLENRGHHYIARITSISKDRGYFKKYQHLPKVYSIWLMVDPPKALAGSIDMQYAITKRIQKDGTIEVLMDDPVKSKYCFVKVYLPEGNPASTDGDPLNILGVLFRNINCKDKLKFLEDNGLSVNKDLSEALMRVRTMEDVLRDNCARKYNKMYAQKYAREYEEKFKTAKAQIEAEAKEKGIAEGLAEGLAKGEAKGIATGEENQKMVIAQRLLEQGLSVSFVQKTTMLSIPEINKIVRSLAVDNYPKISHLA